MMHPPVSRRRRFALEPAASAWTAITERVKEYNAFLLALARQLAF
jgi:hypothetical protein